MPFRRILCSIVLGVSMVGFWVTGYTQKYLPELEYVPTPQEVVLEMLKMAEVTKDDIVYDLGCGDGRIVITAAKLFGARGVGVDIDPELVKESNENSRKAGVADRVKFFERDLFQTNMREATVVTLYLLPELNLELRPKLFRELQPGTRVISHEFDMDDWKPDKMGLVRKAKYYHFGRLSHERDARFYYWIMPADVGGVWHWSGPTSTGERQYTLRLSQKFQEVSGQVKAGKEEFPLKDARLAGDRLSFTVTNEINKGKGAMRFSGRISGNTIKGSIQVQEGPLAGHHIWTAKRGL